MKEKELQTTGFNDQPEQFSIDETLNLEATTILTEGDLDLPEILKPILLKQAIYFLLFTEVTFVYQTWGSVRAFVSVLFKGG